MGHYARVIRGGKVLNTDTDKILLEDGNCILYEENGYINHIEKVNKDNNSNCALLRAHYPNDFFTGDDLLLETGNLVLGDDGNISDFIIAEKQQKVVFGGFLVNENDNHDDKIILEDIFPIDE